MNHEAIGPESFAPPSTPPLIAEVVPINSFARIEKRLMVDPRGNVEELYDLYEQWANHTNEAIKTQGPSEQLMAALDRAHNRKNAVAFLFPKDDPRWFDYDFSESK